MGCESEGLRVEVQVHARIVHQGSFMDIDVKTLVSTHLEGSLHCIVRPKGL